MRHQGDWKWVFAVSWFAVLSLAAAPAAPSYHGVERKIASIREGWAKPGAPAQPNAAGWNALFDALLAELHTYTAGQDESARLGSLSRLYQMSGTLAGTGWRPATELREELRAWLRPRVRLAWAERRLVDHVRGLGASPDPSVASNRDRWVRFVGNELGAALRLHDGASTIPQRLDALKHVYGALNALATQNHSRPWSPSVELQAALNDLYNIPNLDISADVGTVAPALSANVIESGPIFRKGYVSQVTAGPRTGFGLLPSDEGIAFFNRQLATSVTPITDFQNQLQQDRRGRRAAKLYHFNATSQDTSELTVTAVLTPNGLRLDPQYQHNVSALITSIKQPGRGLGRLVASILGQNQAKITEKVYEGAVGRIQQNVIKEAAELGAERTAQAQAQKNAQLAQYLLFGRDAAAFRNLIIEGLRLRSRPENVLLGGTLHWLGAVEQVGADAPQPARFAVPDSGVSADLHLSSILTSLTRGYLQSEEARSVENLMLVTRNVPPGSPPGAGVQVTRNASYATYLATMKTAREANDPKVMAIRVKRPPRSPEFAADARGYLVALLHDLVLEVPVPAQLAKGGLLSAPAQVYRIVAPDAEVVISFRITPETQKSPVRLAGKIEGFDPGPGAKVFTLNEDESKVEPLAAFNSTMVLGTIRTKIQGQSIDLPLSNLKLRGFAIREVSPLDPSGWLRVNLDRTSSSPAAGIQ